MSLWCPIDHQQGKSQANSDVMIFYGPYTPLIVLYSPAIVVKKLGYVDFLRD